MALDGTSLVVYDQNRRARDSVVGAYVFRWKGPGKTFAGISIGFYHIEMPFVRHSKEVDYVRRLSDLLLKSSNIKALDLSC